MQIEIIRSKRRHVIETSVNARGEVIMRVPYNTGKEEIQRTLQKQREWILRHVEKAKQDASRPEKSPFLCTGNRTARPGSRQTM